MRTTQDKLDLLFDAFVHPESYYAAQGVSAQKDVFYYTVRDRDKNELVFTKQDLLAHVKGRKTFAPYQISREDTVKWVCIDIDGKGASEGDIQQVTRKVAKAVKKLTGQKTVLVEDSGNKEYHVWVLCEEPVSTAKGYALGHMIVEDVSAMEGIDLEVFPKQQTKRAFGNTVKLPLGIHQKTGKRCVFVNALFEPYEDQWQRLERVERVPAQVIDALVEVEELPENRDTLPMSASSGAQEWVPLCLMQVLQDGCAHHY